ncbi:WecB/TagA/CpsF family glycosyltransferase [Tenacibaculum insulae]|uniref:WecB/TagA/CpsF family glycosyltransferase n=1 Tax=Tenacibaculum insulae TaxID=2029677 RepID=UPI003AB84D73
MLIEKIKKLIVKDPDTFFKELEFLNGGIYSFLNPYSYNVLRGNIKFDINKLDGLFVDGILLVLMLKFINIKTKRYSFDNTSAANLVFKFSELKNKKVFLIGSKSKEIKKSSENFLKVYPKLNIVGYRNGYFTPNEKGIIIENILKLSPDIVVVGMGTPMQESFLIDLKEKGFQGIGFSCGGFLHQSSKKVNYFPKIINKLHLRFLYRMFKEKEIFYRNLRTYPVFLYNFLFDILNERKNISNR